MLEEDKFPMAILLKPQCLKQGLTKNYGYYLFTIS